MADGGLELSSSFLSTSYLTYGHIAGIVVGSIAAAAIVIAITVVALKTKCFRGKGKAFASKQAADTDIQTEKTVYVRNTHRQTTSIM